MATKIAEQVTGTKMFIQDFDNQGVRLGARSDFKRSDIKAATAFVLSTFAARKPIILKMAADEVSVLIPTDGGASCTIHMQTAQVYWIG